AAALRSPARALRSRPALGRFDPRAVRRVGMPHVHVRHSRVQPRLLLRPRLADRAGSFGGIPAATHARPGLPGAADREARRSRIAALPLEDRGPRADPGQELAGRGTRRPRNRVSGPACRPLRASPYFVKLPPAIPKSAPMKIASSGAQIELEMPAS